MQFRGFVFRALVIAGWMGFAFQGHAASKGSTSAGQRPTGQTTGSLVSGPTTPTSKDGTGNPVKTTTPQAPAKDPKKEEPKKDQPQQQSAPSNQQPSSPTTPSKPTADERAFDDWLANPANQGSKLGSGKCKCGDMPSNAASEIKHYYELHKQCITGTMADRPNYHMAINDYSRDSGCMYIVDLSGTCIYALNADYGVGSNNGGGSPTAHCGSGSLGTPSGFHVTGPHNGGSGKYDNGNSMEMVDLQGQDSKARGVLIHNGNWSGGAGTWGCTGVSKSALDMKPADYDKTGIDIVKEQLPYGSLVYNYFPEDKRCAGQNMTMCSRPAGAPAPGASGNGGTAGTNR